MTLFDSAVPHFTVPDVVKTAEYYRDVLGFEIDGYFATPPVFAMVRRGAVEIFFSKANGSEPRTGRARGAYDAYLRVRGVTALDRELRERGADVIEGPVVRVYGSRELVVRDINGLVLAFGESGS
ncbi:MAG TPA: VOC family protein [Vicinamibacterales bacterium]|nr:VOC family protein [Vicinamibacterales bacterium]